MTIKPGWDTPEPVPPTPLLPLGAEVAIHRAGLLTGQQIARLDALDRTGADARLVAWELLRDTLNGDPELRLMRLAARDRAWQRVNCAATAAGLEPVVDDGYWRVTPQVAAGAARLARFAACALIAPELLEDEVAELLTVPWVSVVGRRPRVSVSTSSDE